MYLLVCPADEPVPLVGRPKDELGQSLRDEELCQLVHRQPDFLACHVQDTQVLGTCLRVFKMGVLGPDEGDEENLIIRHLPQLRHNEGIPHILPPHIHTFLLGTVEYC